MQARTTIKKSIRQHLVLAHLNEIYPNHDYFPVISSVSRAMIETPQSREIGFVAGRQIVLTVMAFTALNLAISEAKALDCSGDPINVAGGQTATGCVIGSSGNGADNMFIYSGGSAISTTINQSGKQVVYDGATASDTVINAGGVQDIEDASLATSTTINSGGEQNIKSGGSATSTTINAGGWQYVDYDGVATSTTINSEGKQQIYFGGSVTSTTINAGGLQNIDQGGKSTGIVQYAGGNVNVTVMGWDPDTEVSGTNEFGAFNLIAGVASGFVINAGGLQNVGFDGSATSTTINAAGLQNIEFGGKSTGIVQRAGGNVNVTVEGGDAFTKVSGTNEFGAFSLDDGEALGFVINAGGLQNVADGGSATSTTINAGGEQQIYSGGSATDTIINAGGLQNIEYGGKSTGIDQRAGGNVNVTVVGGDTDTVVSGTNETGAFSLSSGRASGFVINAGGLQNIENAGVATSTTINSDGEQNIYSGGFASATTVNTGGLQNINSGGKASASILNGGRQYLYSGALAIDTVINNGGEQIVDSSGTATDTTVNIGGLQNIENAGVATSTIINSGGEQNIYSGGSATSTSVNTGGLQNINSGGEASASILNGGEQIVDSGGTATNTTINTGSLQKVEENGLSISTTINSGGEQNVYSNGSATSTTINAGGLQNIESGGKSTGIIQRAGGNVNVAVVGGDADTEVSGTNEIGAFTLSNGLASGFVINAGGLQNIENAGVATSTSVNTGGLQNINSGGEASASILNGGEQIVDSGGTATNTTINTGSLQKVEENGLSISTTINSGGEQNVYSGGFATATTVNTGGLQNINSGGKASASILNGGRQYLYSRALAIDTVINNGGEQIVDSGGTATNTTINTGSLQKVISGGTANDTTLNGGALVAESGALFNGVLEASNGTIHGVFNNPSNLSVNLANNSLWTMQGDSSITHLALTNSTIRFDTVGAFKTLTLTGDLMGSGQFVLNTNLGDLQGDKLIFQGNTNGSHTISINNTGGEPAASKQSLEIVEVTGSGANNATFALAGGYVDAGAYRYTLEPGSALPAGTSGNWYLYNTGKASQMSRELQAVGNFTDTIMIGAANNLYKRMGELRFDNQHQGNLWVRTYHKDYRNTLYEEASGTQQVSGVDIGADKLVSNTNGRLYLGGLFSYGESDFKTSNNARFDSDHYQLGLYATWLHEGGSYIDITSRYFWFNRDYRFSQGNADFEHASNKTEAFLLSLEAGHRFVLAQNWFIEPQAELIMTRSDSFNLTSDRNNHLSYDTGKSTLLRGGLMFGKTIRDQTSTMQVYAKLNRLEYLRASYDVSVNDSRFNSKKPDGSWMAATGIQVQQKNMQIYLEADANVGSSDIKQRWGINLGARWLF